MKHSLIFLPLLVCSHCVAADGPRPITLEEVGDLVRTRRWLAQIPEDKRSVLIVTESEKDGKINLKIDDRYLFVCAPGLSRIFGKEVLISKKVEHLKISLEALDVDPAQVETLLKPKLDQVGVALYQASRSIFVLGPKE